MSRSRVALAALATLAACTAVSFGAQAQTPSTAPTIKFIITHPAGGLPDTVARIVGRRMQERLNQTIVVENRSGANGGIAVNALTSAPADGTTFVVTDGAILSINPQLYSKLPYNPKDVAPIAALATAPLFLAVHPSMPVSTMKEFIAHVKANPGKYNIGSSGVGSIHHISLEALKTGLGLQYQPHPVQGHRRSGAGAARRARADAVLGLSVARRRGRDQAHHAARDQRRDALVAGARSAGDLRVHPRLQLCAVRRHLRPRRHAGRRSSRRSRRKRWRS